MEYVLTHSGKVRTFICEIQWELCYLNFGCYPKRSPRKPFNIAGVGYF